MVMVFGLLMTTACMPAMKTNTDQLEARAADLQTILLLTPDIQVYSISAGDVKEEMLEWSEKGREFVTKTIRESFEEKNRKLKILDPKTTFRDDVDEIKALHLAVISSIYDHAWTYEGNMELFPKRVENFDYSVGSVKPLLDAYKADGMLIVRGEDNISTAGRKALGVVKYINPLSNRQQEGITFLAATLTDINGDVLWWDFYQNEGDYDLRDPEEATKFVKKLLGNYPGEDQ